MSGGRSQVAAVLLALVVGVGAAACGDDDGAGEVVPATIDPDATTTSSAVDPDTLPPPDAIDLEEVYGEALAALGLRLTPRGGLIDRSGGGYYASPTGTHLALYVEPVGDDHSVDAYLDGIVDVAKVFSDVFDRWPGLETYDVCQEPPDPDGTQGEEPLPVTQIELTRAESDAIDWDTVTVVDIVRMASAEPRELILRVGSELTASPAYQAIVAEAAT